MIFLASIVAADLLLGGNTLSEETKSYAQPYWDCVTLTSAMLEVSGEEPEAVLVAAQHACREERLDLEASIEVDFLMGGKADQTPAALSVMAELQSELRSEVYLLVSRARARRNFNANDPSDER